MAIPSKLTIDASDTPNPSILFTLYFGAAASIQEKTKVRLTCPNCRSPLIHRSKTKGIRESIFLAAISCAQFDAKNAISVSFDGRTARSLVPPVR
jgi:hypothetical protein